MQRLLRFLELVRRELGADDVRGEIGGRDPGPDVVWATTPGGIRVVAVFDVPPPDLEERRSKLRALLESFASLGSLTEPSQQPLKRARAVDDLHQALDRLAHRARAVAAIVIDDSSPVIWGSSPMLPNFWGVEEAMWVAQVAAVARESGSDLSTLVTLGPEEVRTLLVARGLQPEQVAQLGRDLERLREFDPPLVDRPRLLAMQAIAAVRDAEAMRSVPRVPEGVHVIVRSFATMYRLVLVFDGVFSELHAEAALIHALPTIERLVLSLPPRDPAASGAKVAVLRRVRPV
jgi:hypothetical protein